METLGLILFAIFGATLVIASFKIPDSEISDVMDSTGSFVAVLLAVISAIGKKLNIKNPVKMGALGIGFIMFSIFSVVLVLSFFNKILSR